MDERERLKRRREALLNARCSKNDTKSTEKDMFLYRTYVTAVIVGLTLLLSLIPTNSAKLICGNLKEAIGSNVSVEAVWQKASAKIKSIDMPNNNDTKTTVKDEKSTTSENSFVPDLPDDDP